MAYHVVSTEDLADTPDRSCTRLAIGETADLESVAINYYEARPGEQIPLAYHYHERQEEAFYVLSGSLAVETPEGEFAVESDETFIAEPESPHRAYNPETAADSVEVLAIGAPPVEDTHPYEP